MKKTANYIVTLLLVVIMPLSVCAQDVRMRATSTIVADALAQLPAPNEKKYNELMLEIASTGTEGIAQLAGMLVPANEGENAITEYALNGVVAYVSASDDYELKEGVRTGLATALENCTDNPNKAFLMTLLQRCASEENVPLFLKYINDSYLADWAANGLMISLCKEDQLLSLMEHDEVSRAVLANVAEYRQMTKAEPVLLQWLNGADTETKFAILRALSRCGTVASIKPLGEAAKKVGYGWDDVHSTDAYLTLLKTLADEGYGKEACVAAQKLLKATNRSNVRSAALQVIFAVKGKDAKQLLMAVMNDDDRECRIAALRNAEAFDDDDIYASLGKLLSEKGEREVKEDILNWFGANCVKSQTEAVISCIDSPDENIAKSAIKAAGKIGGDDALSALVAQLNGKFSQEAEDALLSFNGNVNATVIQALDADKDTQVRALSIVGKRHITETSDKVFEMLSSPDSEVSVAAYGVLPRVVQMKDLGHLCALLEDATPEQTLPLQKAIGKSLEALPKDEQFATIMPYAESSANMVLYYPVLAQAGNTEAIAKIMEGYNGIHKDEAYQALLSIDNTEILETLYNIAASDKDNAQSAILRYNYLVSKAEFTPECKYLLYRKALEITDDAKVCNTLVNSLAETTTYPSLLLASAYLDNPITAEAASYAVRNIVSKNEQDFGGSKVDEALQKAKSFLSTLNDADAGYAADDINGMLAKLPTVSYVQIFNDSQLTQFNTNGAKEKLILQTDKDFENFELLLEWKGNGQIGVRSMPAIQIGGEKSGALFANLLGGNIPDTIADNVQGEWNTLFAKIVNDRVTIYINGVKTVNNAILENSARLGKPILSEGKIMLISNGESIDIRDVYVRELPPTPRFELSPEEVSEGYDVLFDGTSMHLWTGNTTDYVPIDGTIYVTAQYGGSGNLYTIKEYSDFIFRFEFRYVREGVNNGVGIRTPMGVDAAYEGMEIQILDHDAPIYKGLREYQQHGSVYGIIPAKRVKFPPLGEWNTEEIRAEGNHIVVTVNGEVILDGDIYEACQGHNVSEDGSDKNPYTVDHLNHPGLFNKSGHVGFLGHGAGIMFRNIRIKDLSHK